MKFFSFGSNSLILFFIFAQHFSIGFKSGEYGGRNSILQPAFSTNSLLFLDLWKLALSRIKTCPGLRFGIKTFSNQVLNNIVSHVPSKHIGEKNLLLKRAEITLCLPKRLPEISPYILCPITPLAYSL
jgi:hypothetical protein